WTLTPPSCIVATQSNDIRNESHSARYGKRYLSVGRCRRRVPFHTSRSLDHLLAVCDLDLRYEELGHILHPIWPESAEHVCLPSRKNPPARFCSGSLIRGE